MSIPHPAIILATWFGAGRAPFAPGTVGSLAALPFAWLIRDHTGILGLAIAICALFLAGIWSAAVYERRTGLRDASPIVVDEVVGQWLTLLLVPPDLMSYAIGFVLFRAFDVLKPWPISVIDQRVKGGIGVMLDDLVAGACAAIVLWHFWVWL